MPDPSKPETEAATSPEVGDDVWQRLRRSFWRSSRGQWMVGVLVALLGFAAITQLHSTGTDDQYSGRREQDLIDLLNGLAGAQERAQSEVQRLETTHQDLQSSTSQREAALNQAQQQNDTLAILAGLVPVHGQGIRITIEDPQRAVTTDVLLDTIQELRTAGAESISFNEKVRVIAQTAIQTDPSGVNIDGQVLEPPYVIDVIGEPSELEGALTFRGGTNEDVDSVGGTVKVERSDDIEITAVVDPARDEFAQPD